MKEEYSEDRKDGRFGTGMEEREARNEDLVGK